MEAEMELDRFGLKSLRWLVIGLLMLAGLSQAQIVIPPGGGESEPEEMVSERESYKAETLNDFSQVYKVDRHFYKLKSEDVGSRNLVIRVVEKKSGGTELSRDIKTIALTIEEESACFPPTIEAISSPSALRNVFSASSQGSTHKLQGQTGLEPDDLLGGTFNYQLPGAKIALTTAGRLSLNDGMFEGSNSLGGYNMHVYRDDGNLDQGDLLSTHDIQSYPVGVDLDAGNYLLAFSLFPQVRISNSKLQSSCTNEWPFCSGGGEGLGYSMQLAFDSGSMGVTPLLSTKPGKGVVPPFQYKAASPGGISRVSMQHNGQSLDLLTEDEVVYFLDLDRPEHLNFLANAIAGQSQVDITLRAENNCGMSFDKPYRIDVLPDVAPTISSVSSQALNINIGQIQQRALVVQDPGFNVQHVKAVLFDSAVDPSSLDLSLSNYASEIVAEIGSLDLESYGWTSARSTELNLRVPLEAKVGLTPGDYQFRFLVFDGLGNRVISNSVNAQISASDFPPSLKLNAPGFRIPAGGKANIEISVQHQAPLSELEYQIGSQEVQTVDLNAELEYEGAVIIDIPEGALIGDSISFSATVTDENGKASTEFTQVEVGDWGENNITIDADSGIEALSLAHSYSNVTVLNTTLRYANPDIKLNRLTIGDGAEVITQYRQIDDGSAGALENLGELLIREQLEVQAGGTLTVDPIYTRTFPGFSDFRSAHGGAALEVNSEAYDSISMPIWPGMSGPDQDYYEVNQRGAGGGVLIVRAPSVVINGIVHANGKNAGSSGAGAGGTVRVHTSSLSGSGIVSANGGNCTDYYCLSSGAGGRVAIYYDSFSGGNIFDALNLQAREGTKVHPRNSSGPGTVFVKAQIDSAPSLLISSNPSNSTSQDDIPSTAIYGLEPHTISHIENIGAGRQRITISDTFDNELKWAQTYPAEPKRQSLVGQPLILDSSQRDGVIYTVVENSANSLIIESTDDLSAFVGKELVGILRLKELRVENKASISTARLLFADNYNLASNHSLGDVPRYHTGADIVLDHLDTTQKNTFLGNVIADSVTVGGNGLNVRGNLTVNGDLSGNGSVEVIGDLNVGNFVYQAQYNSFRFKVSGNTVVGSALSLDVGTYEFSGDLNVDSIALSSNTIMTVGNNLTVSQGVSQKDSSTLQIANASNIGADLDLDNRAQLTLGVGDSIVVGAALLENSARITDSDELSQRTITVARLDLLGSSSLYVDAALSMAGALTSTSTGGIGIAGDLSALTVDIENANSVRIANGSTLSANDVLMRNIDGLYVGTVTSAGRFELTGNGSSGISWGIDGIEGNPQTKINANRTVEIEGVANTGSVECSGNSELTLVAALTASGGISLDNCKLLSTDAVSAAAQLSFNAATLESDSLTLTGTEGLISQNESLLRVKHTANFNGPVVASSGTRFAARNLSATVFQLDGSTQPVIVNAELMQSTGAMTLIDTVIRPMDDDDTSFFDVTYPSVSLQLISGGTLLLNENAKIDVSDIRAGRYARESLGLPVPECLATSTDYIYSHAGVAAGLSNCFYGHYDRAETAGFGSGAGGNLSLEASTLNIQGQVLAHAQNNNSSGGSIKISADQLLGSGSIDARGYCASCGSANSADGGGRILIAVDDVSGFTGDVWAQGAQSRSQIGGAGTILYANRDLSERKLLADNGGNTAAQHSTPVHSIGERLISAVSGNAGVWNVDVSGTPWASDNSLAGRLVNLDVNGDVAQNYTVHSHSENRLTIHTSDDLSGVLGQTLIGVHIFETLVVQNGAYLDFGSDRVIVNNINASTIDLSRIRSGSGSVLQ